MNRNTISIENIHEFIAKFCDLEPNSLRQKFIKPSERIPNRLMNANLWHKRSKKLAKINFTTYFSFVSQRTHLIPCFFGGCSQFFARSVEKNLICLNEVLIESFKGCEQVDTVNSMQLKC